MTDKTEIFDRLHQGESALKEALAGIDPSAALIRPAHSTATRCSCSWPSIPSATPPRSPNSANSGSPLQPAKKAAYTGGLFSLYVSMSLPLYSLTASHFLRSPTACTSTHAVSNIATAIHGASNSPVKTPLIT